MRKILVVAALLAVVGAACSSKDDSTVETPPTASATPEATSSTASFAGAAFSFTLKQDNDNGKFYFEPSLINAQHDATATVTVSNVGSVEHNLTITSLHVNKDVQPGKSVTVTIHLGKAGQLPFYCEYHRTSGMTGTFIVK